MATDEDRWFAEYLMRGLYERCALITPAQEFFGLQPLGRSTARGRRLLVRATEQEFLHALTVMAEQADGLWPNHPPRRQAVQLMLVHADEDLDTQCGDATDVQLSLPAGEVRVRPLRTPGTTGPTGHPHQPPDPTSDQG